MIKRIILSNIVVLFCTLTPLITVCKFSESQNAFGLSSTHALLLVSLVSFIAIFIKTIHEIFEEYTPFRHIPEYREKILHKIFEDFIQKYKEKGLIIRVNFMYVKRKFYAFGLKKFEFRYQKGFESGEKIHPDKGLQLWWFQGVCGKALKNNSLWYADPDLFKEPFYSGIFSYIPIVSLFYKNPFRLTKKQKKKTKAVRGICSIPVARDNNDSSQVKIIGVLNIDTLDEQNADVVYDTDILRYCAKEIHRHIEVL